MYKKIQRIAKNNTRFYEIIKFCICGSITTLIDMAVMALVIFLWDTDVSIVELVMARAQSVIAVMLGTSLGFAISFVVSYALSVYFVFRAMESSFARSKKGMLAYLAISLAGFFMHTTGMYLGHGVLHLNEWVVKIALTLIVMVFSYTTRRAFVFCSKKREIGNDRFYSKNNI